MRILLINQNWFAPELRILGHEVLSCGSAQHLDHCFPHSIVHIDNLLAALPNGFKPDRIVWHDNSAPLMILGLEECQIPTLFYSVDTHHHHLLHSYLSAAFDYVCIAQKDYLNHFSVSSTPKSWFPLWASETITATDEQLYGDKRYGATFVGTLNRELNPDRVDFFEKLERLAPIKVMQGHFPSIFPLAEIVVNQTVKGDLNFRVFEAMVCGPLLLTEKTGNGLLELFQDEHHLITYTPRDASDAADKIATYLANPRRLREIARCGREEILARHRPIHRALELEKILRQISCEKRSPKRYLGAMINLYYLSSLLGDKHPAISQELLGIALNCAGAALTANATPDSTELAFLTRACQEHDLKDGSKRGAALWQAYLEAFPEITRTSPSQNSLERTAPTLS